MMIRALISRCELLSRCGHLLASTQEIQRNIVNCGEL